MFGSTPKDEVRNVERQEAAFGRLSADESVVLAILARYSGGVTFGQLRSRSSLSDERLEAALGGLRDKGLIARLNTVVESYCSRFPGVEIPG